MGQRQVNCVGGWVHTAGRCNVYDMFRKVNMVMKYCGLDPRCGMLDLGFQMVYGFGPCCCVGMSLVDKDNEAMPEWHANMCM